MRTVAATRYVTPLREGGSLPAVVEADDGRLYVMKFRGAGQGAKALVAELLVGELARACGLPVPELVKVELDPALGRNEPDPEIRDLLVASAGLNLALAYLPGALGFDAAARARVDPALASRIVWLDAYVTNVDRTPRNPNLLLWRGGLWLIDHGAALYFHHAWEGAEAAARGAFPLVRDHVLLGRAALLRDADRELRERLGPEVRAAAVAELPDAWLAPEPSVGEAPRLREAYARWLEARLAASGTFVEEAVRARAHV